MMFMSRHQTHEKSQCVKSSVELEGLQGITNTIAIQITCFLSRLGNWSSIRSVFVRSGVTFLWDYFDRLPLWLIVISKITYGVITCVTEERKETPQLRKDCVLLFFASPHSRPQSCTQNKDFFLFNIHVDSDEFWILFRAERRPGVLFCFIRVLRSGDFGGGHLEQWGWSPGVASPRALNPARRLAPPERPRLRSPPAPSNRNLPLQTHPFVVGDSVARTATSRGRKCVVRVGGVFVSFLFSRAPFLSP